MISLFRIMQSQVLASATVVVVGCTSQLTSSIISDRLHVKTEEIVVELPENGMHLESEMKLQYLGVGGFAFDVDGIKVITAPSYSNPHILNNIPLVPLKANESHIDKQFPWDLRDDAYDDPDQRVRGIIVGHSHYDHLLDVPHLMKNHLKDAKAYGSETARAILDATGISCDTDRAVSIMPNANKEWQQVGSDEQARVRILPITSTHAPHILGHTFQTGTRTCGEKFEVREARDWVMGEVYAYLIDFRNEQGNITFRVYYQDSAAELHFDRECKSGEEIQCADLCEDKWGRGKTSVECELRNRKIDIAILTLAGANKVSDTHPVQLVRETGADLFVIGHWEDFFDNYDKSPVVARGSDADLFVQNLEEQLPLGAQWILPNPSKKIVIKRRLKNSVKPAFPAQ